MKHWLLGIIATVVITQTAEAQLDFSRGSLNNAELLVGYLGYTDSLTAADNYKIASGQGMFVGFITTKLLGIGVSYLSNKYADKVDDSLTLKNEYRYLDIYLKLPVPNILEVVVGTGIGQNDIACESDSCLRLYKSLSVKKSGSYATHMFAIAGVWIGKIYNLQLGFHLLSGSDFTISDPSFASDRKIPQSLSALSAGVGILF